jgi:hypothetical protein
MNLLDLKFSEEEYTSIQDLAACNYTPEKIAMFLQVDKKAFLKLWYDKESEVRKNYELGKLVAEFEISNTQKQLAQKGNITAAQVYLNFRKDTEIEAIRNQILFGHDAY